MEFYDISLVNMYHFLLVVFRAGGLLMSVPIFSHRSIPMILRIWIIFILGFILYPLTEFPQSSLPPTMVHFVFGIGIEIFVGLLMGYCVIVVFAAVQFAGHICGMQMGLAVANILDPMGAGQVSIIGEFYYFLSLLIFLLIDGHHFIIEALVKSYEFIPIGGAFMNPEIGEMLINMTGMLFIVAVKLAAPVLITLVILNSVMGILARTVPQMNIFILGYPLANGVGFAMIALTVPVFAVIVQKAMNEFQVQIATIIHMLQG